MYDAIAPSTSSSLRRQAAPYVDIPCHFQSASCATNREKCVCPMELWTAHTSDNNFLPLHVIQRLSDCALGGLFQRCCHCESFILRRWSEVAPEQYICVRSADKTTKLMGKLNSKRQFVPGGNSMAPASGDCSCSGSPAKLRCVEPIKESPLPDKGDVFCSKSEQCTDEA
ncbi:hypothetical protein VP01_3090g1 [Puccinia sorghi]|uniref:Uncharacterized protein n=1 Tax=Puccinia sorghi TaxID=27349 RepID=A0A0L6UZK9_9BASI|nr:hypothetical protein VP01_3090g1 [Puccinia sorghi]